MFDPNNFFNALFVIPILNILIGLYKFLLVVKIPGALGFALIGLTVIIRFILNPLTTSQMKSAHKLAKLKPELDQLQARHKDDKQRLHQEQLRLYKEAGVNPAAGCLPLLVQMPILIALYNLFFQLLNNGDLSRVVAEINKVVYFSFLKISSFDLSFLGLNLAQKPSDWTKFGWWLLMVPVITAVLQYWQTKMMVPQEQRTKNKEPFDKAQGKQRIEGEKKEEDISTTMQKQMSVMMPIMIGFFAYSFPLGLSLYWNTFTVFGIIQQYQLNKHLDRENGKGQKDYKH